MATVYEGNGWGKKVIGECENGTLYIDSGWGRKPIGEYENGTIYSGTGWGRKPIGEYENGTIYSGTGWGRKPIGEYENGTIYSGTDWGRKPVGECDGSPAGAALLLLTFNHDSDPGVPNNDSNEGCLTTLLAFLFVAFRLLGIVLRFYFTIFWFPAVVAPAWFGWIAGVLAVLSGATGITVFTIIFVAVTGIPFLFFWPYWIVLMWRKIRKRITWRDVFKFYGYWFLKGPFAYKKLFLKQ